MDAKYENTEFWESLKGCTISVQGTRQGKVFFKAKLAEAKLSVASSDDLHLSFSLENVPEKMKYEQDQLNRWFNQSTISENNGVLSISSMDKYDVYITLPEELDFRPAARSSNGASVAVVVEEKPKTLLPYKGRDWVSEFENIILLRHGVYTSVRGDEPGLSVAGRAKIKEMTLEIERQVGPVNPIVLSSTARRAFETGFIIADHFGVMCERSRCIGDRSGDEFDKHEFLELLFDRHKEAKTIIVASHAPFCASVTGFLVDQLYGGKPLRMRFSEGDTVLIDLKNHECRQLLVQDIPV